MTFDWTDFLRLAKTLVESPNPPELVESCCRSATSRAYYAAYHRALEYACHEGHLPLAGDEHRDVQRYFTNYKPTSATRRKVAVELGRLRDSRRRADYDTELRSRPSSLAQNAIQMADSVLEGLTRLRSEQAPQHTRHAREKGSSQHT